MASSAKAWLAKDGWHAWARLGTPGLLFEQRLRKVIFQRFTLAGLLIVPEAVSLGASGPEAEANCKITLQRGWQRGAKKTNGEFRYQIPRRSRMFFAAP